MKILFFLVLFCCSNCFSSSSLIKTNRRMGIEIETSAIKTNIWGNSIITLKRGQAFFILEGDTTDVALKDTEHSSFNKNIECHTEGGLEYLDILEAG